MIPSRRQAARRKRHDPSRACAGGSRAGARRGAVLVHAAVAMLALLAFPHSRRLGTLWVARGQAQNAVDAAALAGAISLAANPGTLPWRGSGAGNSARRRDNQVWGRAGLPRHADLATGPSGRLAGHSRRLREGWRSTQQCRAATPLPMFFSRLWRAGPTRALRASASGKVMTGERTDCLRPIAIPDAGSRAARDAGPRTIAPPSGATSPAGQIPVANPDHTIRPGTGVPGFRLPGGARAGASWRFGAAIEVL